MEMNKYIQTRSGVCFDLEDPQPSQVRLTDICYALNNIQRFTGHGAMSWSVAEHSMFVESIGERLGFNNEELLCCLLHDATEAYVGDLSSPLKSLCPGYQAIEAGVWRAIATFFGLPDKLPDKVKQADKLALLAEAPVLLGELKGPGWPTTTLGIPTFPPTIRTQSFYERVKERMYLRDSTGTFSSIVLT